MKTIIFTIAMTIGAFQFGFAQQLFLKTGATVSNFQYKNSQGQALDNLQSAGKFHFGIGNRYLMVHGGSLYFTYGASWNNYGAIGSDARLDNFFEWDLTYIGLQTGLDIGFLKQIIFRWLFQEALKPNI